MIITSSQIANSNPLPPPQQNPHFPFKLISTLASKPYWIDFTKELCRKEHQLAISSTRAATSCLETMRNLCHIFSQTDEARRVYQYLLDSNRFRLTFPIEDKSSFILIVDNLFYGAVLNKDEDAEKKSIPKVTENLASVQNQVFSHLGYNRNHSSTSLIAPFQNHMKQFSKTQSIFKSALQNLKYDFNKPIISQLRSDIYRNQGSITDTTSYIYSIAILEFDSKDQQFSLFHTFTLEQFCHKRQDFYRIYQSSQNSFTLDENLKKKAYGPNGENCENWPEINEFLKNIATLLSPSSEVSMRQKVEIQNKYFGAFRILKKPTFYSQLDNTLKGTSFRYKVTKLENPKMTMHNLHQASSGTSVSQPISDFLRNFK